MSRFILAAFTALALASCQEPARSTATNAPPPPVSDLSSSSFTSEQQADIRAVVRDYLVRDPTVLREALDQLEARTAADRRHEIEADPRAFAIGPADAPITIVEFFDYRCPYCHAAMAWLFNVKDNRRDVRIVFKEFPVLGAQSLEAARAALAAQKQNRYLQMHEALMGFRGEMTSEQIDVIARQAGVNVERMRRDMEGDDITAILQRNHELAAQAGVNGTPGFMINGEWTYGYDEAALNRSLREAAR